MDLPITLELYKKDSHFWADVDFTETCWLWIGCIDPDGYGRVSRMKKFNKNCIKTHRYAWMLSSGENIPEGKCILHKCDVRNCVRPDHLSVGSFQDNIRDMILKGRNRNGGGLHLIGKKGESHPKAKLNDEKVREIRKLHKDGYSQRDIADMFFVSRTAIRYVISGINWTHVT